MQNPLQTVISQWANSPRITALVETFNAEIDPSGNIDNFYNMLWNIDTAVGYGLDVWGRIVGVPRTITVQAFNFFGFQGPSTASGKGFNQAPFYSGGSQTTENVLMTDDAYRTVILAKAAANLSDATTPAINAILFELFGPASVIAIPGQCFVQDPLDMTMELVFGGPGSFAASISGTIMTMTAGSQGAVWPGQTITGTGVSSGTTMLQQLTGATGGPGTYTVQPSQTVSSTSMASQSVLTPLQYAIIHAGIIPRPAGVSVTVIN